MYDLRHSFQKIASSKVFQRVIFTVVIISCILAGLETYVESNVHFSSLLQLTEHSVFYLLVAEFMIKFGSQFDKPIQYFKSGWNLFDFFILVGLIATTGSQYSGLLAIAPRLLRSLKLLTFFPSLQSILVSLRKSIPSLGSVIILLSGLFYVYGIVGNVLFGTNDPVHFSSLHISLLTMFRVITLEDWTDVMYIQMFGCDAYGYDGMKDLCIDPSGFSLISPLFFISFVFFGSMIIINLFVGIITSQILENMNNRS